MSEEPILRNERACEWEYDGEREGPDQLRWKVLVSAGRTQSSALSMGILEVPSGTSLDPHHHGPQEVYYVTEGWAEVFSGGSWAPVGPGDVIYWPGDFSHGIRNLGEGLCKVIWMFGVDAYDDIEYVDD